MKLILSRPDRLRKNPSIRALIRETRLSVEQIIRPIFVTSKSEKVEIPSMPGQFHFPLDKIEQTIENSLRLGINAVMLFGIPSSKDEWGSDTVNDLGIIQQTTRIIRKSFPDLIIFTDACFCQYTTHGHCGIIDSHGNIDRLKSLSQLQKLSISYADAGSDFISPSCMIDGMVKYIRESLDENGFEDRGILSYSAKFESAFYGPFREAADSSPQRGDRKKYQMDPCNIREAIKEAKLDEDEGADIIMIKPALPYLDVISKVKEKVLSPVAAYQVSGEYSMIKSASNHNWIDGDRSILESLLSIKRAGADIIITYFADDVYRLIESLKK